MSLLVALSRLPSMGKAHGLSMYLARMHIIGMHSPLFISRVRGLSRIVISHLISPLLPSCRISASEM